MADPFLMISICCLVGAAVGLSVVVVWAVTEPVEDAPKDHVKSLGPAKGRV